MISDAEQRRLAEIETVLRRDDPAFVQRFNRRRLARRRRHVLHCRLGSAGSTVS